ncbi:hypothetical protein [Nitritalea halalkaliphila]|uniref:hypothetical protein n=1 Tax=Nitritalea halalkaliphila TaxID=590849 RepID=UPI0002E60E32|nr:hypothetical protein [Nitritalea halalkaliphila]
MRLLRYLTLTISILILIYGVKNMLLFVKYYDQLNAFGQGYLVGNSLVLLIGIGLLFLQA